jgi:hypothetical protein
VRRAARVAAVIAFAITAPAFGKGASGGHSGSHSGAHSSMHSSSGSHSHSSGSGSLSGHRGKHAEIKRREHARSDFMQSHPCPSTGKTSGPCPGYDVGGGDEPPNMQWQAVQVPM